MKRLATEIEIMKKLKHNNIIQLIEVFDNSVESLYLVMELYVPPLSLRSPFPLPPLSLSQSRFFYLHPPLFLILSVYRVKGGELFDKVLPSRLSLSLSLPFPPRSLPFTPSPPLPLLLSPPLFLSLTSL